MALLPPVDPLWFRSRDDLNEQATAVAKHVDAKLRQESRSFNVAEPEVEREVAQIPPDAPDELAALRQVSWRHVAALNCHRLARKPSPLDRKEDKEVEPEHPITGWLNTLSDTVLMALIRENPLWLRNPAAADRVCRWRVGVLDGDDAAVAMLRQLPSKHRSSRRGHPIAGPVVDPPAVSETVRILEEQARATRDLWIAVRDERGAGDLIVIGDAFLRRFHFGLHFNPSTEQVLRHLGLQLVLVRPTDEGRKYRWVVIDDDGWPRASTLTLLAARWDVSKGWIRQRL